MWVLLGQRGHKDGAPGAAQQVLSALTAASVSTPLGSDGLYSATSPPEGLNLPSVRHTPDERWLMPLRGGPHPAPGGGAPGGAAAQGSRPGAAGKHRGQRVTQRDGEYFPAPSPPGRRGREFRRAGLGRAELGRPRPSPARPWRRAGPGSPEWLEIPAAAAPPPQKSPRRGV